jgi:hypothetical protein
MKSNEFLPDSPRVILAMLWIFSNGPTLFDRRLVVPYDPLLDARRVTVARNGALRQLRQTLARSFANENSSVATYWFNQAAGTPNAMNSGSMIALITSLREIIPTSASSLVTGTRTIR